MVTDGRGEDKKTPHLKYMFHNDETCHTYTLPKEYQKNIYIKIKSVTSWALLTPVFFTRN